MPRPGFGGQARPGFEPVVNAFRDNFHSRQEVGAACAVVVAGEVVVDLWGGWADERRGLPWASDSLQLGFSCTKGLIAAAMARLVGQGGLSYDEPLAHHWPEFAAAGKEGVTLRQLLEHQAGLHHLDEPLPLRLLEPSACRQLASTLARQRPHWPPGSARGYHTMTLGLYADALVRRITGRSISDYFAAEVAGPAGLDCHMCLPPDAHHRVTRLQVIGPGALLRGVLPFFLRRWHAVEHPFMRASLDPRSDTSRAYRAVRGLGPSQLKRFNEPWVRSLVLPSAVGFATARSFATLYGALASDGSANGHRLVAPSVLPELCGAAERGYDRVLRGESAYSVGFARPARVSQIGWGPRSFGFGGAGGSLCFGDPDQALGFAYLNNRMGWRMADPRFLALRDATYVALQRKGRARGGGAGGREQPAHAGPTQCV